MRTDVFGALDDDGANCGCPSLLLGGVGFGVASDCDCSSASLSSIEIIIDCDSDFLGPVVVALENGSGCKEQTSRASTATDRNRAQKSCAPKSRDPCSVSACLLKSSCDSITSALDSIASWEVLKTSNFGSQGSFTVPLSVSRSLNHRPNEHAASRVW